LGLNHRFYTLFQVSRFFLLWWDLKNRVKILNLKILMGLWVLHILNLSLGLMQGFYNYIPTNSVKSEDDDYSSLEHNIGTGACVDRIRPIWHKVMKC